MDSRKYNKLDPFLHQLSSQFHLKEDQIKEVNEYLSTLLKEKLIPVMTQVDDDFKNLYRRLHYSGSYYENLRICDAHEFDLNLELRSQARSQKFIQIYDKQHSPGFVQIEHLSSDIIKKWTNNSGFVLQYKVLSWLQGVVDKALPKITGPWQRIWRKMSGPAVTICVEYKHENIFTIDLVPVFVLDQNQWPKLPVRQPIINKSEAKEWCVVPKPNDFRDFHGSSGTFWRISFYNQEKDILNNKNHLKNALKLMKQLRDQEGWHCLASYYLKTVFLWAVTENEDSYWNNSIGVVFMNMLRTLRDHLRDRKSIPFFWDERHNLLSSVDHAEIQKIGNRLENIIKKVDQRIDNDPGFILTLFPDITSSDSEEPAGALAQQDSSVDWMGLTLGLGAITLGGVLLFKALNNNNNRD